MTLYFAYGSNLNKKQMKVRCPKAKVVGTFTLNDARLVFRGVADVIADSTSKCVGGIWKITKDCELALDRYEGFNPANQAGGMYRKVYLQLAKPIAGETELMLYVMNSEGIMPPSQYYLDAIRQGYKDFGIDPAQLKAAVERSHDDRNPSHIERQRQRRNGNPQLAQRPSETKKSKPVKPDQPKRMTTAADYRKAMTVYGD